MACQICDVIRIFIFYIDPVYDEEFAEPRETEKYEEYTGKLWELLTKHFKPFNCAKRCKAPSGFFNGQPWLFDENSIINKVMVQSEWCLVRRIPF